MKKLVNSLVSIAHSLNALVEIQFQVLEIAKDQTEWTRARLKEIQDAN